MRGEENLLSLGGDGAHFHTLPLGVVFRVVAHLVEVEVALEKSVNVLKYVEDKFRGYSLRIVVGPLYHIHVLDPIHPEEQKISGPHGFGELLKESDKFRLSEVPYGTAQKDK